MIERLQGKCCARLAHGVILDVQGVGYGISMPLSSLCEIKPSDDIVTVWTYTYVREDTLKLFGFLTYEERHAFEILLSVNGVGPKVAMAILSTLGVSGLKRALTSERAGTLEVVPGVGPRLAERILVEMKSKVKKLSVPVPVELSGEAIARHTAQSGAVEPVHKPEDLFESIVEDIRSALENLGFKDKDINQAIKDISSETSTDFGELMKKALSALGKRQDGAY